MGTYPPVDTRHGAKRVKGLQPEPTKPQRACFACSGVALSGNSARQPLAVNQKKKIKWRGTYQRPSIWHSPIQEPSTFTSNYYVPNANISLIHLQLTFKMASPQPTRWAALARDTNETKIQLALNLDGGSFPPDTDSRLLDDGDSHASQASKSQRIAVNTGIGFLDHMLHALAKHSGWSLAINCKGDLHSTLIYHPRHRTDD